MSTTKLLGRRFLEDSFNGIGYVARYDGMSVVNNGMGRILQGAEDKIFGGVRGAPGSDEGYVPPSMSQVAGTLEEQHGLPVRHRPLLTEPSPASLVPPVMVPNYYDPPSLPSPQPAAPVTAGVPLPSPPSLSLSPSPSPSPETHDVDGHLAAKFGNAVPHPEWKPVGALHLSESELLERVKSDPDLREAYVKVGASILAMLPKDRKKWCSLEGRIYKATNEAISLIVMNSPRLTADTVDSLDVMYAALHMLQLKKASDRWHSK